MTKPVLAALAALLLGHAAPAQAQETPSAVSAWYEALREADRDRLGSLLAPEAKIDLRDLDVVQTREEFLESLDSWEEAMDGAQIEAKPLEASPAAAVMDVCYRFPGNEQRNRESFKLSGEKIVESVQEQTGDSCDGF